VYSESCKRAHRLSSSIVNLDAVEARELEELQNELQVGPPFQMVIRLCTVLPTIVRFQLHFASALIQDSGTFS